METIKKYQNAIIGTCAITAAFAAGFLAGIVYYADSMRDTAVTDVTETTTSESDPE